MIWCSLRPTLHKPSVLHLVAYPQACHMRPQGSFSVANASPVLSPITFNASNGTPPHSRSDAYVTCLPLSVFVYRILTFFIDRNLKSWRHVAALCLFLEGWPFRASRVTVPRHAMPQPRDADTTPHVMCWHSMPRRRGAKAQRRRCTSCVGTPHAMENIVRK